MQEIKQDFDNYKVWFISIIWRPNTGKSSFINSLLWEKVSIVSSVPQTTRKSVLGIYNDTDSQIIFFDTPWIHTSEKEFNKQINKQALWKLQESDVVLYFIDSTRKSWEEEKFLETVYGSLEIPKIKVFTKSDLIQERIPWEIYISNTSQDGYEQLLKLIKEKLPVWPLLYPLDFYTTQDMGFRVEETIREKIFLSTSQEIPHSVYVQVDDIHDEWKLLKILAYIFTETESQKKIIIGKKWALLSEIWKQARLELESIFGKKIFLSLRVKVAPKWRSDEKTLKKLLS